MRIDVITLFPEMFAALDFGIPRRATEKGLLTTVVHPLREHALNRYGQVDDSPFGGEPGMVLRPEPLKEALEKVWSETGTRPHCVFPTPQGQPLDQKKAKVLAGKKNILILCGHYKGIDERIRESYVDQELSLGDYVLSGGEFPALVMIDAVARLLPDVLGDAGSAETDSFFQDHRLGWPVYTRPDTFEGKKVPPVLLSGNHAKIESWRRRAGLLRTQQRRPDLFSQLNLSDEDKKLLSEDSRELL